MSPQTERIVRMTGKVGRSAGPRFTIPEEVDVPFRRHRPDIEILIRPELKPTRVVRVLRNLVDDLLLSCGASEALKLPEIKRLMRDLKRTPARAKGGSETPMPEGFGWREDEFDRILTEGKRIEDAARRAKECRAR